MSIPVQITVHADRKAGPWRHIYRFFGCDEINYTYMPSGQALLRKLGSLAPSPPNTTHQAQDQQVYFRAHHQFCTSSGATAHGLKWGSTNAYTETPSGTPIYDWTTLDRIYDAYLAANIKPYVQFGFMPKALSTHPSPYRHSWAPTAPYTDIFTGWSYPPTSFEKWGELCYEFTKHCVGRYGKEECESWWWEAWNEPDIGYWGGTREEFCTLHDYTVAAVKRALPGARVGGPETTGGGEAYLRAFLEHCIHGSNGATGGKGGQLDFVSFHAKGRPVYIDGDDNDGDTDTERGRGHGHGHVRMDIAQHLRHIDASLATVASFPQHRRKPVVIAESDPEGAAAAQGPQLRYRNGTLYASYTAASFARKQLLADKYQVDLQGALTWAFEFESQPFFAGFRVLSSNGLDLPVLNVFRMFARMRGAERVEAASQRQVELEGILRDGVRGEADVGVIACRDREETRTWVMVWHYHDDDVAGPTAAVEVTVKGGPAVDGAAVTHYRIDGSHSNAYARWLQMGSPQDPTPEQYEELQAAGTLAEFTGTTRVERRVGTEQLVVGFELPRQGVSLVVVE